MVSMVLPVPGGVMGCDGRMSPKWIGKRSSWDKRRTPCRQQAPRSRLSSAVRKLMTAATCNAVSLKIEFQTVKLLTQWSVTHHRLPRCRGQDSTVTGLCDFPLNWTDLLSTTAHEVRDSIWVQIKWTTSGFFFQNLTEWNQSKKPRKKAQVRVCWMKLHHRANVESIFASMKRFCSRRRPQRITQCQTSYL